MSRTLKLLRRALYRALYSVAPFLCLTSCLSVGAHSPVVVEEPLFPKREARAARSKAGLRITDRSCESNSQFDPGCALGSLPVFELPHCGGIDHAAMPVLVLPPDVHPYDCSVDVRSIGEVPFTFDPAWRATCQRRGDGSHECAGVFAYASLSGDDELDLPHGVQAVLTLRCTGVGEQSKPLVMSERRPDPKVYPTPACTVAGQ